MKLITHMRFVTDLSTSPAIFVVLVCHAYGHPPPTYRWMELGTANATNGPKYTISIAGEYSLECTASNDVTFANGSTIQRNVSTRYYVNGKPYVSHFCLHSYNVSCHKRMLFLSQWSGMQFEFDNRC